ncbi:MAG: gluconolaconase [Cyclobacteriaceae bacterium]|nr:gluconolaconase [Cyclobacteriaceae bacterium]
MKTTCTLLSLILLFLIVLNCTPKKSEEKTDESSAKAIDTRYNLEEAWATEAVFKTPESVIYDKERAVLYVANVNENPWEKDGNGFISKVSTTGEIIALEWVAGMSGPKGMGIIDNILYVADLDELVAIDIDKGEIINKTKIDGASGLNDITIGNNQQVFISDSNEGKIFRYQNGATSILINDATGRPNGLLMDQNKLFVAFSEASEFVSYDPITLHKSSIASGIGAGDGIIPTQYEGAYLVSDWNGEIFLINQNGEKQSLLNTKTENKNTADICYLPDGNLVLVPTFFDNRVVAYSLSGM